MFGTFGFSYIGLIFLLCLFVPNTFYGFYPPKDRLKIKENTFLLGFERVGQGLCTVLLLCSWDLNLKPLNVWSIWLIQVFVCLVLYLAGWVRYFRGEHTAMDFYRPLFKIPLPLAVLPVTAVILLGVYGKVASVVIAGVILGIGHIGVTAQNYKAYRDAHKKPEDAHA